MFLAVSRVFHAAKVKTRKHVVFAKVELISISLSQTEHPHVPWQ